MTLALVSSDPRFLPVTLNGRHYITSTLLHKQKREAGMLKYEEVKEFNRMIRNIDCYDRLIENEDLIEITKNSIKSGSANSAHDDIVELFKSNYNNPILLISPTAQKEIEHFLDDEQSKLSSHQSSHVAATLQGGYGLDAQSSFIHMMYAQYVQLENEHKSLAAIQQHQEKCLTSSQVNNGAIRKELNETKAELLQINCRVGLDDWLTSKGFTTPLNTHLKGKISKMLESHGCEFELRHENGCRFPTKLWKKGDLNDNFDRIHAVLKDKGYFEDKKIKQA